MLHLSALFKKKNGLVCTEQVVRRCVRSRVVQGAVCLLYRGCQIAQLVPPRGRGNGPCSMLMNIHPLNATPPHTHTPSWPHLAPRCLPLDTSTRKHAGSRLPLHSEGEFYLTGGRNSPRESAETLSEKCRRETKNPITPTVSTVTVGCISCCLH